MVYGCAQLQNRLRVQWVKEIRSYFGAREEDKGPLMRSGMGECQ